MNTATHTDPPASPTELDRRSWWSTLKRTVKAFQDDQLIDWAAALTYYAVLAIFPALIALVSILGLFGQSATEPLLDNLGQLAPGAANQILTDAIENIAASQASAGIALILGLAGALWSASGYVSGFARASNAIYEVEEGRSFWKLKPIQIVITAALVILLAICAIAVVLTGSLAEQVGKLIGVEEVAVTIWGIAKWPAIAVVVISIFAVLYWTAPNVEQPAFKWITPGGILAVVLWLAASGLFALYVANFSAYNATYGSIAGVIIFLVWLWITNLAILLGAELNAELERERELEHGVPRSETIALDPREPAEDE